MSKQEQSELQQYLEQHANAYYTLKHDPKAGDTLTLDAASDDPVYFDLSGNLIDGPADCGE